MSEAGDEIWIERIGKGPVIATAIHDGHELREEVRAAMIVREADRLREEDPFTGEWTGVASTALIATHSRFEVDLNRPRDKAVYRTIEDSWGIEVWASPPADALVARSLQRYDAFYARLETLMRAAIAEHGKVVVLDLHSYNHRRGGPDEPPDDPEKNPQVNVGTGTMNRTRWAPMVDPFIASLRAFPLSGGALDVRENVRFRGGNMVRWIHETFPETACGIAVEIKKFYMDEWTGEPIPGAVEGIKRALASTISGLEEALSATPPARTSAKRSARLS